MKCLGDLDSSSFYYGMYPPVLHRYWGDAKVWSNFLENTPPIVFDQLSQKSWELPRSHRNKSPYRPLSPQYLCLLTRDTWKHIKVAHWESEPENIGRKISYLFVAYSSEHFSNDIYAEMEDLHKIGMAAARKAGVDAFWVGASCMRDEEELENDVSTLHYVCPCVQKKLAADSRARSTESRTFYAVLSA